MKKRILCYGDSDTWGQIAGTGERRAERWPVVCRRLLGEDFEVLEDGISGRTTVFDHPKSPWLNGLKGLGYALMAHRPLDAVVLFLGSNDVLYTDAEGSADGVAQLVSALVDADNFAHSKLPVFPNGVKVLLIGPPLSHPDIDKVYPGAKIALNAPEICKYEALYSRVAETYCIDFLDSNPYTECSPVDCVHMTGESHVRLGEAIAQKLLQMFNEEVSQ